MDGPTAQIAALTIAGNHYLKGGDITGWWPDSPVFKFCKSVRFVTLSDDEAKPSEHPHTDDPPAWFAKQKAEGVLGFRLVHIPVNKPIISDRMSAGFVGGGGRKIVECVHASTMDGWEAGWRIGDQKDPARKIWQVNYARVGQAMPRRDIIPYNLTSMVHGLQDALVDIAVFAKKHEQAADFAPAFDRAMAALKSKAPLDGSFNFKGAEAMLPDVRAQKILAASDIGWVFGAMGSWNDIGFDGDAQKEYDTVSDKLFDLMVQSIVAAANSTFAA